MQYNCIYGLKRHNKSREKKHLKVKNNFGRIFGNYQIVSYQIGVTKNPPVTTTIFLLEKKMSCFLDDLTDILLNEELEPERER